MAKFVKVEGLYDIQILPFIANLCQDEQDKKDLNNFIKDLLNVEKKAVLEKIRN